MKKINENKWKKMNYIQCVCSCIYSNYCFQIKLEFKHDGFFGTGIKAKQENSAAKASAKTNDKMNLYDTVFRDSNMGHRFHLRLADIPSAVTVSTCTYSMVLNY